MKKTTALLLSGTAAVATFGAGGLGAAANPMPQPVEPQSYADLLEPIPNAVALLRADNARLAAQPSRVQLVQFHHHHHHHHHHHGFLGGFGFAFPGPYYNAAPDCHWTWGRPYWNGYRWARRRVRVCD